MSAPALRLVPKRETIWKRVTCEEAKALTDTCVVWWRPNLTMYSQTPEQDLAWVLED